MSEHFIERCRHCSVVLGQCRCPSPNKTVRWSTCAECDAKHSERPAVVVEFGTFEMPGDIQNVRRLHAEISEWRELCAAHESVNADHIGTIATLTAERDALKARLGKWSEGFDLIDRLTAERDAAVRELNATNGTHTPGEAYSLSNPRPSLAGVIAAERDKLAFDLHHQKEVYAGAVLTVERLTAERNAALEMNEVLHRDCAKTERDNERLRAELTELRKAAEAVRTVRINHAPGCPAHDGEPCDCAKRGAPREARCAVTGEVMRMEFRQDTDPVVALVRAARTAYPILSEVSHEAAGYAQGALFRALKHFEKIP